MTIDRLAYQIKEQADRLFPQRTDASMFIKLYGEIAEMIDATDVNRAGEVADVLIMVLDYAKVKGINVEQAIRQKMAVNDARTWKRNDLGAFQHVGK